MKNESTIKPLNGYLFFFIFLFLFFFGIFNLASENIFLGVGSAILAVFVMKGFFIVNPNKATVMVLFGKYTGTVKENGFKWTNPFYRRISLSLRARNFDSRSDEWSTGEENGDVQDVAENRL